MNAPGKRAIFSPPLIRKVIPQSGTFVCGLCKNIYDTVEEARGCLNACWNDALASHPVQIRKQVGHGMRYRCIFCSRDYTNEPEALHCAKDCKKRANAAHQQELATLKLPVIAVARRKPRTLQGGAKIKPKLNLRRGVSGVPAPAATMPPDLTSIPELQEIVPADEKQQAPPPKPKQEGGEKTKRRSKDHWKKPFFRKGAKYECAYCAEQYFTKSEVDKCFGSHFDGTGLELI
ncbi:MAG: hypothetical protein AB7T49_04510 [Oligoflexales bacterium]